VAGERPVDRRLMGNGGGSAGVTGVASCCLLRWWRPRPWLLTGTEYLDDAHQAATAGAWLAQSERDDLGGRLRLLSGPVGPEQGTALRDVGFAGGAGEQAVVPYAVKAVGQHVDQEPSDELVRREPHDLLPVAGLDAVVLPGRPPSRRPR